jgi:hypothetical protein
MKKQLNENTIVNELRGSSAFFRNAAARTPERANGRTPERPTTRTDDHPNASTPERPDVRTGKRQIARHSFNFYQDQIVALKRLVAQRSLAGDETTLSDLARQAIDDFLAKDNTKRTPERAHI